MASSSSSSSNPGQALVDFTTGGLFPDEAASSIHLTAGELPGAVQALAEAKAKLENQIRAINAETAEDVSTWLNNAKAIQDDIARSKSWANDIVKRSEAPDVSGETVEEAEEKAAFLVRELDYNYQVQQALKGIRKVNRTLDEVERASSERRILDALRLLERSWTELDAIPASKSCRAMRLLDIRAIELKSDVHDVFDHVWKTLVHVDVKGRKLSITQSQQGEPMSLSDAVIGLKAYKEVDQRMAVLWHDLDTAIVRPRTDIRQSTLPAIQVLDTTLQLTGDTDKSVRALFADLETILSFLSANFPRDLLEALSEVMIPQIVSRITDVWLSSAVPSTLEDMDQFEDVLAAARDLCEALKRLDYRRLDGLEEWIEGAPRVWLSKCRETALDTVRIRLANGLGSSTEVERVETQMVSFSEGKELTTNGASAAAANNQDNQDWDAAWSDEEDDNNQGSASAPGAETRSNEADDDGADAWGAWGDDDGPTESKSAGEPEPEEQVPSVNEDEEDAGDAWGWGDEVTANEPQGANTASSKALNPVETREMTLRETYHISSLPEQVLALISAILEDGASLTSDSHESSPVAAAAAGLFSLPTLTLAMFRAISGHYYSPSDGGNMFLYNDAMYLAERLGSFAVTWKKREDLSTRAQNMLRLDNEIKTLQNFANRTYSKEMNIRKTIIRDHLAGSYNLFQQDDTEMAAEAAISLVQSTAAVWENILARSAWYQAVGSLVDAISAKIIADVMDMPSIGQDEAYSIANLIAEVTELDSLFLPSRAPGGSVARPDGEEELPATFQYVPTWFRLKFLSEVLQSNLRDVRFLWMESDLSLYFTVDEVLDLINLSFEDNARTREVVKEITQHPQPRAF